MSSIHLPVSKAKQAILRWIYLPDLVSVRVACILSNMMWALSLMQSTADDPFVQLLTKIVPLSCWMSTFWFLAASQLVIMATGKTHTKTNLIVVLIQTSVWIFLTAVFYKALYPGSLMLANSAVIAVLSAWSFIRADTKATSNMRRWIDNAGAGNGSKSSKRG